VVRVEEEWGQPLDPQRLLDARREHPDARLVSVVHAETSTGVENDIAPLAALRDTDTLLLVDTVTSLGGIPVEIDEWGVDASYSGTQKCLGVPPGLSPVTFSPRAVERVQTRALPPQSWYLDVSLIANYVDGASRVYHHTAPVSMVLALHAALGAVLDEGLEAAWARHRAVGTRLQDALPELGFRLVVPEGHRLPELTTAWLPEGADDATLRKELLGTYGIEVGGGLGRFAGQAWRIGLMGHSARERSVTTLLGALRELLG
jgi:alanine-glyoxylate transaminase/serine-glyoxylate transaminase/serine-pyruvate transaminase